MKIKKKAEGVQGEHYRKKSIEPINIIESYGLGFNLANNIKYTLRAEFKGTKRQDLKKAMNYLHRELYGEWVSEEYFAQMDKKVNK